MKTYVLTVSTQFPATHVMAGRPTHFVKSIAEGKKLHTLRKNFPLWQKRIREIQDGNACLSVRIWTGKPYRSKQQEVFNLRAKDGLGIERLKAGLLELLLMDEKDNSLQTFKDGYERDGIQKIANNDGLCYGDFKSWFKDVKIGEDLAVIHFTPFRYENS